MVIPPPMLNAFVITLREGLEAFLIVAIILAYIRKTQRPKLVPAVYCGIVVSVVVRVIAGVLLARASNAALWEGILALTAAVLVLWMIVHMWRVAKHRKKNIEGQIEVAATRDGTAAFLGVFGFTVLMITREGMETAFLMNALIFQVANSGLLILGAAAGTLLAAFVAWLWSRHGHRVNLARFFQVTAVFLLIFVVQLVIYGFHELTEAHIFPYSDALHWATEPYGPDGMYGRYFSYLLVMLPLTWLLVANVVERRRQPVSIRNE